MIDHNNIESIRLFEWMSALMMVGVAMTIAGGGTQLGSFAHLADVGLTARALATIFVASGVARLSALYFNGRWPVWGPRARAAGALVGAVIWIQMFYALASWSSSRGFVPIGVPVYLFLTLGEVITCYRAAADGAVRDAAARQPSR